MEKGVSHTVEKESRTIIEVVVDFLRHGETNYTDVGRDLTAEGESQITEAARRLLKQSTPKKILSSSGALPLPARKGSEEILKELLAEKGLRFAKNLRSPR